MVELLVSITIIAILAAMTLGALQLSREAAREAKTKATIAKLNSIVMDRYESYLTRRVPINTTGFPGVVAAQYRLFALRDLIRMEMPDRPTDSVGSTAYPDTSKVDRPLNVPTETPVKTWSWSSDYHLYDPSMALPGGGTDANNWNVYYTPSPFTLTNPKSILKIPKKLPSPPLARLFWNKYKAAPLPDPAGTNGPAEALYMFVSLACPEAMEQFSQSEIGDTDKDGWPEFIDGWGRPISFLRWAPGFSNWQGVSSPPPRGYSDIQTGNTTTDHDPFDARMVDGFAFHLIPLIYSGGPSADPALDIQNGYAASAALSNSSGLFADSTFLKIGQPMIVTGASAAGNITNHRIEQR